MKLTEDQKNAADWLSDHSGLLLAHPGTGKTRTTLAMLEQTNKRAIIVAPASVTHGVWQAEAKKIEHRQRITRWPLKKPTSHQYIMSSSDHLIMSYNKAADFFKEHENLKDQFDVVVFDEVNKLRNPLGVRYRTLRDNKTFKEIGHYIGLTGIPVPNRLMQLYGQLQITVTLPFSYTGWKKQFFFPMRVCIGSRSIIQWQNKQNTSQLIFELTKDMVYRMQEVREDKRRIIDHWVTISLKKPTEHVKMLDLKQQQQYAQGRIYNSTASHDFTVIHDSKKNRLEELLLELQGQPVIVFYYFYHDLAAIQDIVDANADIDAVFARSSAQVAKLTHDWNARKISVLVTPFDRISHGLNLQYGGDQIIFYALPQDADIYEQCIKRLDRPGQTSTVMVHRILARGSNDAKIIASLNKKAEINRNYMTG